MADKQYVWFDGKFLDSRKATVHILTHSLQYGSGIFEGIRAYKTAGGTSVFRLVDHVRRFLDTARMYEMAIGYGREELEEAILLLVKKNRLESCYIRPFAFYNDTRIGLGTAGKKVSVAIAALPFGEYFDNRNKGIRCRVSSWRRINSDIMMPHAKASGNYRNSILASEEAKRSGSDEAIMLGSHGYVAEGPGENIFMVSENRLLTPPVSSDILVGITRDSVIKVARSLGISVEERELHREELYTADELFFTGTAAEITPIISVDSKKVGAGHIGPVTKTLSERFSRIVHGEDAEFAGWSVKV